MTMQLEEVEGTVQQVFIEEFPKADLAQWNQEMDDEAADNIISTVDCASRINIRLFIEDIW